MRPRLAAIGFAVAALLGGASCGGSSGHVVSARADSARGTTTPRQATLASSSTHHYEYVFPDGAMYVYDLDNNFHLVEKVDLSGASGIRGVVASPRTHTLYVSHGGDGSFNGNGSLLAYDLVTGKVLWDRSYNRGIDSMAVSAGGTRIYMPDGELSSDGVWMVIDARSGSVIGRINGGAGPHNTVVGLSGKYVYLGGRDYRYLDVASTSSNRIVKRVGPLVSGVRPFTINGRETVAYTTATGFLGFQVSSLRTGRVLYTVDLSQRFPWSSSSFSPSAPSHGISLAPNERQVWVIDAPSNYVHVFDVSRVPGHGPRRIADLKLSDPLTGRESDCSYDCARDGWLQHSRDGCFVFVGDSGDVFSGVTFKRVGFLPALRNTRKHLEIDWRGGLPVSSTSRHGLGYVRGGSLPPTPSCR